MSLVGTIFRRLFGKATPMLTIGTQAPEFTLPAHDGSTISLAELRGKRVVLWFYPKADTPG